MTNDPPTTAYVVTQGAYSDYQIVDVFLDKALAERFVAEMQKGASDYADPYEIEEWKITSAVEERVPVTVVKYSQQDGLFESTEYDWRSAAPTRPEVTVFCAGWRGLRARCVDAALARKAMQDRIAQMRATQEGIT